MGFSDLVLAADRVVLNKLGETTITYAPTVGDPVAVDAVFDQPFTQVDGTTAFGVEQLSPVVWVVLADLPSDPETDDPTITIDAIPYRVVAREYDSLRGTVRLSLHRTDT
jgi:hypothetical protein